MSAIESGLYTVKDDYFRDFPNSYFKDNKNERRPYFYLFKDKDDILWMIPMSSKVETYRPKIEREEAKRGKGNCDLFYIGVVSGIERVFSICDMFPITEDYIRAPFTISNVHYIVKNKSLNQAIYSRAMRFLALVQSGKMHSSTNIMEIKRQLLARKRM